MGTFKRKIIKYGTNKVAQKPPAGVKYTMYIDTTCDDTTSSSPKSALEAFQAAYQYLYVLYGQHTAMTLQFSNTLDEWDDYYIHFEESQCHYVLSNVSSPNKVCVQYSSGPIDERIDHTAIDLDREEMHDQDFFGPSNDVQSLLQTQKRSTKKHVTRRVHGSR